MNELEDKLNIFYNLFRSRQLKITPQRIEIYKALAASKEHPSAEAVYENVRQILPNVSLDTVNRTLNTFAEIGVAFVVEGSGDVRRFDANLESHQHFKCVRCKKIFDFFYDGFKNISAPVNIERDFKVLRTTVYVEGLCKTCLEKKK